MHQKWRILEQTGQQNISTNKEQPILKYMLIP